MKEIKKYFQEPITIIKTDAGLTNQNFKITTDKNQKYMAKVYSKIVQNNEVAVNNLIRDFDAKVFYIDKNIKITNWINFEAIKADNLTSGVIKKMAQVIKKLHAKKITSDVSFNPFTIYKSYLKKIINPFIDYNAFAFVVKKAQNIASKRKAILCHNDLVLANFLDANDRMYLIDWEYAGNNDPLFDVSSFLTENNLYHTSWKDIFLKHYFQESPILLKDIEIWHQYQSLMFLAWSNLFYEKTKKQVYIDIALMFIKNINRQFQQNLEIKNF